MGGRILWLIVLAATWVGECSSATVYIKPSGNDSAAGSSWALAKRTVQAGIDAASSGSEVWVAAGTYVGNIALKPGLGLYGGFSGVETSRSARDPGANVTVLEAKGQGSVVTASSGITSSTVIDGFLIRGGSGTAIDGSVYGGGILCHGASPTISNNAIALNKLPSTGFIAGYGAGICSLSGSPIIVGNTIAENIIGDKETAPRIPEYLSCGAGIFCTGGSPSISGNIIERNLINGYDGQDYHYSGYGGGVCCADGSPSISDNTVRDNFIGSAGSAYHSSQGGGVYLGGCSGKLTNNVISGNAARNGGGLFCAGATTAISTNTLRDNQAADASGGLAVGSGGGLYVYGGSTKSAYNALSGNKAVDYGGGMCYVGGTHTISNNWIRRNSATLPEGAVDTQGTGGGIYYQGNSGSISNNVITGNSARVSGGGIGCYSPATVSNNLIASNTAGVGGGFWCHSSSPTLTNNTVAHNQANGFSYIKQWYQPDGGGVYCGTNSAVRIANSIVCSNSSGLYRDASSLIIPANNCTHGNGGYDYYPAAPGVVGIKADPQFVNAYLGDYHLKPTSPLVNAGDNSAVQTSWKDIDGQTRILAAAVDIGFDELAAAAPAGGSFSPSGGTLQQGIKITIKSTYSDPDGFANLSNCYILLNTTFSEKNAIAFRYDANANLLYGRNDAGTSWTGGKTPGLGYVIDNSQAILYCSGTSVSGSSNTLTITWRIVLKPVTAGQHLFGWLRCTDDAGNDSGWALQAEYDVPYPPANLEPINVSQMPSTGDLQAGVKVTFRSVFFDPDGFTDLAGCHLLLTPTGYLPNSAYFKYDFSNMKIYLKDDASTYWQGGYLSGSSKVIQNSFCYLYCAETKVTFSGNTATVDWVFMIKPEKVGTKVKLYTLSWDYGGLYDDWTQWGSMNIVSGAAPPPNNPPVNVSLSPTDGTLPTASPVKYTAVYSDADGYGNLANVYLLLNDRLSEAYAAVVRYDQTTNKLYVRNDSGSSWVGGYAPGAAYTIGNKFFALSCTGTSVSRSGNYLTVDWLITLKPLLAGASAFSWIQSVDVAGAKDSWEQMGSYSIQ